jgi:hypothetical protein
MRLTALATILALAGIEIMLFPCLEAWLTRMLGAAGAVLATLLLITLPIASIFVAWYAARRIAALLWPKRTSDAQDRPTRRRIAGQHQF